MITLQEAETAYAEWGANCGPGALAACLGLRLDAVRPHLVGFEQKHYTNITMMRAALKSLQAAWSEPKPLEWPASGLVRLQWEGPWTEPEAPWMARQRHTHWVAGRRGANGYGVFDINCCNNGTGWVAYPDWTNLVAPWIISECVPAEAYGTWHITHALEIRSKT